MNLSDITQLKSSATAACDPPSREQLERLALRLARRERELFDLGQHIEQQRSLLAELRRLLLAILWPRRSPTT